MAAQLDLSTQIMDQLLRDLLWPNNWTLQERHCQISSSILLLRHNLHQGAHGSILLIHRVLVSYHLPIPLLLSLDLVVIIPLLLVLLFQRCLFLNSLVLTLQFGE